MFTELEKIRTISPSFLSSDSASFLLLAQSFSAFSETDPTPSLRPGIQCISCYSVRWNKTLSLQETSRQNKGTSISNLLYLWLSLFWQINLSDVTDQFPCLKENIFSLCLIDGAAWVRFGKKGSFFRTIVWLYRDFGVNYAHSADTHSREVIAMICLNFCSPIYIIDHWSYLRTCCTSNSTFRSPVYIIVHILSFISAHLWLIHSFYQYQLIACIVNVEVAIWNVRVYQ
jgi:hypothetical protein